VVDVTEELSRGVDPAEASQLALDLAAIPSPTGHESELGEFIIDWMASRGLLTVRQELGDGMINAVGILPGSGQGPSLILNGHMDILPKPEDPTVPYMEDGILYGAGMDNMKSGLAAIMTAAAVIQESGLELAGDLIIACVAGEITDEGRGTRYLLTHGMVSTYAIVADTSHFGITWADCGVINARITTTGRALYTPFTRRSEDPRRSENAIIRAVPLVEALEDWAREYERREIYRFAGGEVRPKVSIGRISGGDLGRLHNTPERCHIYVDIRVAPGALPLTVQRELRDVIAAADVDHEVEFLLSQRGYEHQGVEPLVDAIRAAHQRVVGLPTPPIDPAETSMWTDTNLFYEAGIPAVKFGLGAVLADSPTGELQGKTRLPNSTAMQDLENATKIFAEVAASICGATRAGASQP
jgi:acetylornithine deacetylase/succinyl-diaminopimelate desuccinylase-like protein